MKKTLLQKAKEIKLRKKSKRKITDEHVELSLAWIRSEVGLTQINKVLGQEKCSGNVLYSVAVWLREAYRTGKIKIKK